ncbi:hypothetical protein V6N13_033946 [Hibiscus sabdariffa]
MSSNERTTLQPQDAVQQAMERFQGQMVVQKISETDGSSSILQLSGFPSKTRTIQWLPYHMNQLQYYNAYHHQQKQPEFPTLPTQPQAQAQQLSLIMLPSSLPPMTFFVRLWEWNPIPEPNREYHNPFKKNRMCTAHFVVGVHPSVRSGLLAFQFRAKAREVRGLLPPYDLILH